MMFSFVLVCNILSLSLLTYSIINNIQLFFTILFFIISDIRCHINYCIIHNYLLQLTIINNTIINYMRRNSKDSHITYFNLQVCCICASLINNTLKILCCTVIYLVKCISDICCPVAPGSRPPTRKPQILTLHP